MGGEDLLELLRTALEERLLLRVIRSNTQEALRLFYKKFGEELTKEADDVFLMILDLSESSGKSTNENAP
jgi:hypothetical protein